MANGTILFEADGYLQGKIEWSSVSNGSSANSSNVTATLYARRTNNATTTGQSWSGYVAIGSEQEDIDFSSSVSVGSNWVEMSEITRTIEHNSDGSKSIYLSGSVTGPSGTSLAGNTSDGEGTVTLDKIPRKSSVTCADGNIGSSTTININRASSTFTHTITYSFGNLSGTIVTKTSETSYGWTIPTSFYAQIPNSNSGQGTITCETFDGNTSLGTSTATFNAFVVNSNPIITATIVDDNSTTKTLTGDQNKLVKYFSNAKVTMTATAKNSATISNMKVICEDGKSATTSPATLNGVESGIFNLSCFDSRGNQGINTVTKTLINYIRLAIKSLSLQRPSSTSDNVNISLSGNYFNDTFGSVSNTLTLKWRYREKNGTWSNYSTLTPTISNNTFSYTGTLGTNFDYRKEYEFEIVAQDKLITDTKSKNVTAGIPLIDIWKDNVGVNGNFNIDDIKALYKDINGVLATNTTKYALQTITKGNNTYDITFKRSGNVVNVIIEASLAANSSGEDVLSNLDFPEWAKHYTETGAIDYSTASITNSNGYANFTLRKTTSNILKYLMRNDYSNNSSNSITIIAIMTYIIEN